MKHDALGRRPIGTLAWVALWLCVTLLVVVAMYGLAFVLAVVAFDRFD